MRLIGYFTGTPLALDADQVTDVTQTDEGVTVVHTATGRYGVEGTVDEVKTEVWQAQQLKYRERMKYDAQKEWEEYVEAQAEFDPELKDPDDSTE